MNVNAPEPVVEPLVVPPPEPEITLEEWIAATQACCGVDHDAEDDDPETQEFGGGER